MQVLAVDLHAIFFHDAQHRDQWHLNLVKQLLKAVLLEHGEEDLIEFLDDVITFVRIPQVAHGVVFLVEIDVGKDVQRVPLFRLDEIMCNHDVEQGALWNDAMLAEASEDRF